MNYNYDMYGTGFTDSSSAGMLGLIAGMGAIIWIVSMAIGIVVLIAMWKMYKKAGKNGWEVLIPVYNIIVLLEIVELPLWYIALLCIPFANIYAMFKIYIELAHKFGKSTGFGVLTIFFSVICIPMLGFGKCQYIGTKNQTEASSQQPMPQPQPVNNMPTMQMGPQMTPPMNQTNMENSNPLQMPMPTDTTINQIQTQPEPTVTPMPIQQPMNNPQPVPPQMINTQDQPVVPETKKGEDYPHPK